MAPHTLRMDPQEHLVAGLPRSAEPGWWQAQVLITVKTYPNPSDKHDETVCVAGVLLNGDSPKFVRLYPMRFRHANELEQFKKYDIVEVPVQTQGSRDPRRESLRPRQSALRVLGHASSEHNWYERRRRIQPLVGATTTCALINTNEEAAMNEPAPSLGLVPAINARVTVKRGEPFTPEQLLKAERAARDTLFGPGPTQLKPAPFDVYISYRCHGTGCTRRHEQKVLDWEAGEAARKWQALYGSSTPERLRDKWQGMFEAARDSHLYVGNQHQHRASFSILGVWYPKRETDPLFY